MNYLADKLEHETLYRTVFDDGFVIWKPLSWKQYKKIRETRLQFGSVMDLQIEEQLYSSQVILSSYDTPPPPDLDFSPEEIVLWKEESRSEQLAGIISTVCKCILHFSGCLKATSVIDQLSVKRQEILNLEDQLAVAICSVFSGYTPDDIEDMEWDTVLKRAAQAEAIMLNQGVGVPFRIAEPEKIVQPQRINYKKDAKQLSDALHGVPTSGEVEDARHKQTQLREQYMRERGR